MSRQKCVQAKERTWDVRHDGHACNPCTQEAGTGEVGV